MKQISMILAVIFMTIPVVGFGQSVDEVEEGIGLEVGAGQNVLFWNAPFNIRTPGGVAADRTHLFVTPNLRLKYTRMFSRHLQTLAFAGYHQFGGKSLENDSYTVSAVEVGTVVSVPWHQYTVGIGGKLNRHLHVRYHLGSSVWNRSAWFTDWSGDVGVRLGYSLSPWSVHGELWFGLTNLAEGNLSGATVREQHARLMLGYTF